MNFLKGKKKLIAFILGVLTVLLSDVVGLDPSAVNAIIAVISSYLVGQGISDNGRYRNDPPIEN